MTSRARAAAAISTLAAVLLFAGCAATPGATTPTNPPAESSSPDVEERDIEAAMLDDGRMFAVVTWGSSSCVPMVDEISAEGQVVSLALVDPQSQDDTEKACTADLAPRASIGALPEGVDPTKDITLTVTYGDVVDDVDLDGADVSGTPGEPTEYQASAGWFDDSSLVLLTWGSSSCVPVVEKVEASGAAGTVTFAAPAADRMCTMDMAPRATIVAFGDEPITDDAFVLTLVGDNLDGTVSVID